MAGNPAAAAALLGVLVTLVTFYLTSAQTQQSQVTDRYTRAVAQLGDPGLDVRLGGIYALERLSRDSPIDQPTVIEVLSAYVRDHLPFADLACTKVDSDVRRGGDIPLISSDVRAALDVLSRRNRGDDEGARASLFGVCLTASNILRGRDLTGFDFPFANLDDALLDMQKSTAIASSEPTSLARPSPATT